MKSHKLDLLPLIVGALLLIEALLVLLHQVGAIQLQLGATGWVAFGLGLLTLAGVGAVVQLVRTELRRTGESNSESETSPRIGA